MKTFLPRATLALTVLALTVDGASAQRVDPRHAHPVVNPAVRPNPGPLPAAPLVRHAAQPNSSLLPYFPPIHPAPKVIVGGGNSIDVTRRAVTVNAQRK